VKVFRTPDEAQEAFEEVRERLGLREMVKRVLAKGPYHDEQVVLDLAAIGRMREGHLRFGLLDSKLYMIEMRLREAETVLERAGGIEGLTRVMNVFADVRRLEEDLEGLRALPDAKAVRATRAKQSHAGRAPKRNLEIYQAVLDYVRRHPRAGVRQIWESFPQDMKADVYRSDGNKFLYTREGKRIAFRSFLRYVTWAREELKQVRQNHTPPSTYW